MKKIQNDELSNVSGGQALYLDGTCKKCGAKYDNSRDLKYKYIKNGCGAGKDTYYCSCGGVVDFERVTADGS